MCIQKQNLCHRESITSIILNHLSFDWRQFYILDFCLLRRWQGLASEIGWVIWLSFPSTLPFSFSSWTVLVFIYEHFWFCSCSLWFQTGSTGRGQWALNIELDGVEHFSVQLNSPILFVFSLSFCLIPSLLVGKRRGREWGTEKALVLH